MKVLITLNISDKQDNFEASRVRKSIKGALEMVGVSYTTSYLESIDVIHLLSLEDEVILDKAIENKTPVVVSCLMSENDPAASFLDFKYKDGKIINTLLARTIRFLNLASVVLVPVESAKTFLIDNGVTSRIEVISSGVNLSRFDFSRVDEKELFYRYFHISKNKKIVIGNGDYENIEGINCFINTAKNCSEAEFFFFGQTNSVTSSNMSIRKLIRKAPSNCRFKPLVPDDIYRSALLNASVFLVTSYKKTGVVSLLEAMAAKCQLIVREQALFDGFLIDGKTAYIVKFSETLVSLTKDYLKGDVRPTYPDAYEYVKEFTLEKVGIKLKELYNELLKN